MAFCIKCGSKLNEGVAFCSSCGTPVSRAGAASSTPPPPPITPSYSSYSGSATGMTPGLVTRVKNILLTPKQEWPVIAGESASIQSLFTGYIAILALIPAAASFIGSALILSAFSRIFPMGYWVLSAVLSYLLGLAAVYLSALIIQKLAPTFESQGDLIKALQLVAYSQTPYWIAGVLLFIPILGALGVLAGGIYGIYLFYLGVPVIMRTPQSKVIPYMITAAVVMIAISVVISLLVGGIASIFFVGYRGF